ncbi:SFT2 domain containing 2a isoform 1-T1 [Spinachia spinachia]
MDKLRSVLSGEEAARKDDKTVLQAVNEASTLGWGTRVKGFVACFVVGAACAVLGVCLLFLPRIGITLFIVFYTFGNLCTICSTMFLMGPMKQLKRMCDKTRALASALMLTCLVLTLCAVFWVSESCSRLVGAADSLLILSHLCRSGRTLDSLCCLSSCKSCRSPGTACPTSRL